MAGKNPNAGHAEDAEILFFFCDLCALSVEILKGEDGTTISPFREKRVRS